MPNVPDVRATSHDRHDPMLVAALAAGDLAGTEREQAIALTDTCTDCAALHADLVAIAHATAIAPPPFAMPARDFRLSAEQAARLRPAGWRRFLRAGSPRAALTRPLGVGLATLGLVGLLVGNVQLGLGSTASGGAASVPVSAAASGGDARGAPLAASPAAQTVEGAGPQASSAASGNPPDVTGDYGAMSSAPSIVPGATQRDTTGVAALPISSPGVKSAPETPRVSETPEGGPGPVTPGNVAFSLAIVLGLGLLVVSRVGGRTSR